MNNDHLFPIRQWQVRSISFCFQGKKFLQKGLNTRPFQRGQCNWFVQIRAVCQFHTYHLRNLLIQWRGIAQHPQQIQKGFSKKYSRKQHNGTQYSSAQCLNNQIPRFYGKFHKMHLYRQLSNILKEYTSHLQKRRSGTVPLRLLHTRSERFLCRQTQKPT